MTAGSALDLIEIDAASNRGIDEIRDLREKVNLAPALGPFKVYIIDEAHMLTEPAFNALLKTLEEPPPHVVFVLCTTDAQKIPLTVIGRCQQFVFRRHSEEQIAGRLTHIAQTENVKVDDDAMQLIARTAQGSMRDAVGLLDQLVPLATGPITLEAARSLLGIADPRLLDSLLDDVLAGRAAEALDELNRVYAAGAELRQVVRGLMESCRDRLVAALTRRDQATARRLSSVLDALLHLDGEVRRHAEPRFLVEATLARLAVELGTDGDAGGAGPRCAGACGRARPRPSPRHRRSRSRRHRRRTVAAAPVKAAAPVGQLPSSAAGPRCSNSSTAPCALSTSTRSPRSTARPWCCGSNTGSITRRRRSSPRSSCRWCGRGWVTGVKVDYRLRETGGAAAAPSAKAVASPEDDPFVREVVRRFDGRVTRVKEVSE